MEQWTTLDMVPTMLDALQLRDDVDVELTGNYSYEGQSLLRKYEDRVQISLANPGIANILVWEKGKKIVFPQSSVMNEEIYDLDKDPDEEKNLRENDLDVEFRKWIDFARIVKAIYTTKIAEWYGSSSNLFKAN